MKALVIGGTRFVGAAIVDALLEAGAAVTVFSRGLTSPGLFAGRVELVTGDRSTGLAVLGDRRFDAVFDSCGYHPDAVATSVSTLANRVGRYVFVSTASVYAQLDAVSEDATVTEQQPVAELVDGAGEDESYGPLKARCEEIVLEGLSERAIVLRPSLIVGPRDYTDRFPYWPVRLELGGAVLVPGDGEDPAQIIDARDLARFAVTAASSGAGGIFNVTGPPRPHVFRELIEACRGEVDCELIWAPAELLASRGVSPWQDMPCWLGRGHEDGAVLRLDITRALDAGLTHRPWRETARDTLEFCKTEGRRLPLRAGLSLDREAELIAALRG